MVRLGEGGCVPIAAGGVILITDYNSAITDCGDSMKMVLAQHAG